MKDTYVFVKDYKDDNILRKSLNDLAEKTFGINFEGWYQSGYWREKYIPYSIIENEKVVSNISVNLMNFICDETVKHYIQLGTVMTDINHRNMGLSRYLIEMIIKEYKNKVDGIYLFANDSVLDFYPKFEFTKNTEYQYSKSVEINTPKSVIQIAMSNDEDWNKLEKAIQTNAYNGQFEMDNIGLIMFYIISFMKDNVYFIEGFKAYVIAEVKNNTLLIHNIFSEEKVEVDNIISAFGEEINQVILGFTPNNKSGYIKQELNKEDSTLFVRGNGLIDFKDDKKMFPILSHA